MKYGAAVFGLVVVPILTWAFVGEICMAQMDGGEQSMSETVVLIHGLGRTHRSMGRVAARLGNEGFAVRNLRYPSTDYPPAELIERVSRAIDDCCRDAQTLHFVTHSLGGLMVRAYLADERPPNLGKVVMLAPPNRGSEVVDKFGGTAIFRWIFGPMATQLGTDEGSFPNRLPDVDYEVGVIAGTASINPFGSALISGQDDGAVAVASTRLDGMTDFVTVQRSHTFIMMARETGEQTVHFLRHGRFLHGSEID